ncbi:Hypothetical protein CINCED_3A004728 [Cinara cedri]|uniref:Six-bladed beta-propeller, TolB-like,Major royal jelly protein/protein yellow n=1 Tax=Cinara cedri TaxID=506608 RepID=A0A5E4N260_9HEMI|nr:Hypothetical protein CINCED_3A004728 [Cinara cedri]
MVSASLFLAAFTVLQAFKAQTPRAVRARTQLKWLINTGDLASGWPPTARTDRGDAGSRCDRCKSAMPNTVTRLQMIRGGTTAVLVMPTGDGGRRCCSGTPQFSLGFVDLVHGVNNLYPAVRPFPDWRPFVDIADPLRRPDPSESDVAELVRETAAEGRSRIPFHDTSTSRYRGDGADNGDEGQCRRYRIVNVVDVFLDERGRLLWVLDTGDVGQDACFDNTPSGTDRSSFKPASADDSSPPKFFAIDVYTNRTISVVSLSRMWRPGVSCFQYIVAVYPENRIGDQFDFGTRESCANWPLIVIGDAGTNRLLVYSHCKDKFTEIVLPVEEHNDEGDGVRSTVRGTSWQRRRRKWPTPPIRDILYVVPLYPQSSQSRLLITYHGCREVYKLRLQVSVYSSPTADTTPPVTGTLTVLGRKPCRMVILGTDRRRTDVGGGFAGGGTTVYFRLENTNDIWSWDVSTARNNDCGSSAAYIDERDFRLVRVGRTCRVPVAVSAAAVVAATAGGDGDGAINKCHTLAGTTVAKQVRQLMWMLETNFVDHYAGTMDRMGVNAKLQPVDAHSDDGEQANTRLRVQPNRANGRTPRSSICRKFSDFKRQVG